MTHGGVTVDLLRTLCAEDGGSVDPLLVTDGVPACALTVLHRTGMAWHIERIAWDGHLRVE